MNIYYRVDHRLLQLKEVQTIKKGQERTIALLLLSMLIQLSESYGYFDYYQGQIAEDFGANPQRLANIMKKFKSWGWVDTIYPYQRKGNLPARIKSSDKLKRYIQNHSKVYTESPKGIDQRVTVIDLNRSKPKMNDSNESFTSRSNDFTSPQPPLDSPEWAIWAEKHLK